MAAPSGSRPMGVRVDSQSQTTGRDLESQRRAVSLSVSGRPAQFCVSERLGANEDGGKSEIRGRSSEVGGQRSEVSNLRSEV